MALLRKNQAKPRTYAIGPKTKKSPA